MKTKSLLHDESGVSVVVGALMLILVMVASVSALALMMSQEQKKAMEQRSLRAAVEGENLKLVALNISGNNENVNIISIDVANLNTEESRITGVNVNDVSAANYTVDGREYDSQNQLFLPPAGRRQISLNLTSNFTTPINLLKNESIKIILFTGLTNEFENVFLPPVPIIKVNLGWECTVNNSCDNILTLDGSDSFDKEGGIIRYDWQVENDTSILNFGGQKVRTDFNLAGGFWVKLSVTDSSGMMESTRWN